MGYLKNKKASFYLMILAGILALLGLYFYRSASIVESNVILYVGIGVGLTVLMMLLAAIPSRPRILNLCATVIALVFAWGLISSVNTQLDPLGWWIAGLYTYDQVKGYIFFAALVGVALLLDIIASFIDLHKQD